MYLCANIRLLNNKRAGVVLEQWLQAEDPSGMETPPSFHAIVGFGEPPFDPNAYAIEVLPATAYGTAPAKRFSHVCSPAEMMELGTDPEDGGSYFRTDSLEMVFDHAHQAQRTLDICKQDLIGLYADLQVLSRYN